MSNQLILITAPFNCGYCTTAQKELPKLCEKYGYEFVEVKNEKTENEEDDLPVNLYPTIMVRINDNIVKVLDGYSKNTILTEIKKY